MGFFSRKRRTETTIDEYTRLVKAVAELQASVSRIETEWADTKDQLRKSYQRVERANQRAAALREGAAREDEATPAPPSGPESGIQKQLRLSRAMHGG
jgi:septal ring factor EnvC (AmiA/AmiB activator)